MDYIIKHIVTYVYISKRVLTGILMLICSKIQPNIVQGEDKQANISSVKCLIYMRDGNDFSILSWSMVEHLLSYYLTIRIISIGQFKNKIFSLAITLDIYNSISS